jgi:hypothetical protein
MTTREFWELAQIKSAWLLARYAEGKTTDEENIVVLAHLAENPDDAAFVKSLRSEVNPLDQAVASPIITDVVPTRLADPKAVATTYPGDDASSIWAVSPNSRFPSSLVVQGSFTSAFSFTSSLVQSSKRVIKIPFEDHPQVTLTTVSGLEFIQVTLPSDAPDTKVKIEVRKPESGDILFSDELDPVPDKQGRYVLWAREDLHLPPNTSEVDVIIYLYRRTV